MNISNLMLVSLSLAIALVSACGGREDDAAVPPSAGYSAPGAAHPLAHLSPKERKALALYVESQGANSDGNRKTAPKAPAAKAVPRRVSDVTRVASPDGAPIDLPNTFPSYLPILPGAEPTRHVSSPSLGTLTEFSTDQTVDEARRFYSNELGKSGWILISDLEKNGLSWIVAEMDGRELSVAITNEDGRTKITTMENQIP